MLNYFGRSFLNDLYRYYGDRLQQAISSNFHQPNHQYYWLYQELQYRTNCLLRTMLRLDALPSFMGVDKEEETFCSVQADSTTWFAQAALAGAPRTEDGTCVFFTDACPYWLELQAALEVFGDEYDYKNLPSFYVDLIEYVIRMVRLHFYVREQLLRPIDRNKFDELMRWKPDMARSA